MDKQAIKELLPCPFCGSAPVIEPWHGGRPTKKMISCESTSCHVNPGVTGETRKEAVVRWNGRADDPG